MMQPPPTVGTVRAASPSPITASPRSTSPRGDQSPAFRNTDFSNSIFEKNQKRRRHHSSPTSVLDRQDTVREIQGRLPRNPLVFGLREKINEKRAKPSVSRKDGTGDSPFTETHYHAALSTLLPEGPPVSPRIEVVARAGELTRLLIELGGLPSDTSITEDEDK